MINTTQTNTTNSRGPAIELTDDYKMHYVYIANKQNGPAVELNDYYKKQSTIEGDGYAAPKQ